VKKAEKKIVTVHYIPH